MKVQLIRRARLLRGLSRRQWSSALSALAMLPRVALSLRRHGYKSTAASMLRRRGGVAAGAGRARDRATDLAQAQEIAVAVRLVAKFVPDATCLRRSLVLHDLLCRRGIDSDIRFGVRPGAVQDSREPYVFHAWVVSHGEVVSESPRRIVGFLPFDDLEGLGPTVTT